MSINTPEEQKEPEQKITVGMGSLVTVKTNDELFVVYDVGDPAKNGPPIKACQIIDEAQNLVAWSGSMYPHQIKSILPRTWPENRIKEAFIKSYPIPVEDIMDALRQIENRGPRTFIL